MATVGEGENVREIAEKAWRILRFPLIAVFGVLPLSFVIAVWFANELPNWVWLWPAGYVVLDVLGTGIRGKWRILYGFVVTALILYVGAHGILYMKSILMVIFPVLYMFLILCGLRMKMEKRNEQINPLWYQFGTGIHLVCQLLLPGFQRSSDMGLLSVIVMSQFCFFLFAMLVMITMNQKSLFFASGGRQNSSVLMKRRNFLLTVFLWGIAALLSLIPALSVAVTTACRWVVTGLFKIISAMDFSDLLVETWGGGAGGESVVVEDISKGENGTFFLYYIAAFLLLPLGYGLFRTIKNFPVFLRAVLELFSRSDVQEGSEYADEITDTRKSADVAQAKKRKRQMINERKLPPNQRIRYRYCQLQARHRWGNDTTARENLPHTAALLYEKIRYGDYIATEQDVSLFLTQTRRC